VFKYFKRLSWRFAAPVLLLIGGILIWFLCWRSYAVFHAIPVQSALVFAGSGTEQLDTFAIREARGLANLSLFRVLRNDIEQVRTILSADPKRNRYPVAAAFSLNPNDSLHPLIVLDLGSRVDLARLLEPILRSTKATNSTFRSSSIFTVEMPGMGHIVVASARNLLFFSRFSYLVEDALVQMTMRDNWWQEQANLLEAPFRVVLRTETLAERLKGRLISEWDHLPGDLASSATSIVFGYDGKNWRTAARTRTTEPATGPGEMPWVNMTAVLPDNAALLAWTGTERPGALGMFASDNINADDFRHFVLPWVGKEAAWVLVEPYSPGMRDDRFWVCAVRDESAARKRLDEYGERAGLLKRYEYQTFEVRQFFSRSLLDPVLSKDRQDFQNPACVLLDGYAVFAASPSALELWIDKYVVSQTLATQPDFLLLGNQLPQLANRFFFANATYSSKLTRYLLDPDVEISIQGDILVLQRTGLFGLALPGGQQGAWSGTLAVQPATMSVPHAGILWKTPLESQALTQPFLVPATAPSKEATVLIQDDLLNLHCLTVGGQLLWRKKLDRPILSAVQGIDFFDNGSVCYLFSTATAIWIIDENGREVAGYPLRLQSPATNGVTAVAFDDEHKYGLFVACENGNLYGFDQYGRPLTGWNPKEGVGHIRHPLVHFNSETKDYFAVLSLEGTLSVFNRIGVPHYAPLNFAGGFSKNPPQFDAGPEAQRIVCMNESGKVHVCNLVGHTFDLGISSGKGANHLVFEDMFGDSRKDYAVLSSNTLIISGYEKNSFSKKAEIIFPEAQDTLFATGQKGYIGTLHKSKRQLYLANGTGKILPGFPLAGTTPFVLYHVPADRKSNILIVGNGDAVYAYKIPG